MAAMAAILDIRTEKISNSEALCHCDASNPVLAQSNVRFVVRRERRSRLKNSKMATMAAYLDIGT